MTELPQSGSTHDPRFRIGIRAGLLALLAVVYLVYSGSLRFGFVYDDIFQIVGNERLDSPRYIPGFFTQHVWAHVSGTGANLYRPLFLLWLFANNQVFAHEAFGWHFTSVLLHVVVTLLVFILMSKLLRNELAGLLAAALFALHPVQVESVAWVSGVTEPLCAVFFLAACLTYIRFREGAGWHWLALSITCYAGALLSKETAAVLPLVLVCFEILGATPQSTSDRRHPARLRANAAYAAILAAYVGARAFALHGLAHRYGNDSVAASLAAFPSLIWSYVRIMVVPTGLSPLYDPVHVSGFTAAQFVVPMLVFAAAVTVAWHFRRNAALRLPLFLTAWFALTLAPALAVFIFAPQSDGFHTRYLYLPSVAFCGLVAYLFQLLASKTSRFGGRIWVPLFAAVTIIAGALASRHDVGYWASNYTLFERAEAVAPHNLAVKLNLANELFRQRQYRAALQLGEEAQQLDPNSVAAFSTTAWAAYLLQDYEAAERYYARATDMDPSQGDLFYFLGLSRLQMSKFPSAIEALRRAIILAPTARGYHFALGQALSLSGEWESATEQFEIERRIVQANSPAGQQRPSEAAGGLLQHVNRPAPSPSQNENALP